MTQLCGKQIKLGCFAKQQRVLLFPVTSEDHAQTLMIVIVIDELQIIEMGTYWTGLASKQIVTTNTIYSYQSQ